MLIAACLAVALGALLLVGVWWYGADSVLRRRERTQWVVTLKDGTAFQGVLTDHDRRSIVLSDAEHYADSSHVPVDGEVVILLADVKYAQRL